jgi:hypothetical protein
MLIYASIETSGLNIHRDCSRQSDIFREDTHMIYVSGREREYIEVLKFINYLLVSDSGITQPGNHPTQRVPTTLAIN